jgi:hypothetical protein
MHGQFVWYELISPDPDASKKFYAQFTGWGAQQFDKNYSMWTTSGSPFAGLYALTPEMRQQGIPPNWMPYVESSDVDATARLATSLGGKVMSEPKDIPNVGRYAVLLDPQGAAFGIYKTTAPSMSWDGTPVVGRMSWHELMTIDSAKAFEFYRKLFGWDKSGEMDMGGGNTYRMYGKGQPFGGMFNRHGDMATMQPFWLVYIHVRDVQKTFDQAVKAGATVQRPPMEIPGGGTIAILGDPQGAAFALHSMQSSAANTTPRPSTAKKSSPGAKGGTKKAAKTKAAKTKTRAVAKKRSPAKKTRAAGKKRSTGKKRPAKKRAVAKKRSIAGKRPATKKRS